MRYSKRWPKQRSPIRRKALVATVIMIAILAAGTTLAVRLGEPIVSLLPLVPKSASTAPVKIMPRVGDGHALGIAAGSSLPSLNASQLASRLNGIQASGASWVRLDFDWSLVQPDSSRSYDWSVYDGVVRSISDRHLQILAILDYTPAWARPANCTSSAQCAPSSSTQFADFAAAAAKRYSPQGVHYWEVWNEPNNKAYWQPAANPVQYVSLLRAAYLALHSADPQAYVITGGLSPQATGNGAYAPYDFLAEIYAHGGKGYFDAVGDHPYTFPLSPASSADHAWAQMASASHSLRSIMVASGDSGKKIWITEFGAPTGGPGAVATLQNPDLADHPYVVDQALQAKILSDALRLYKTYSWGGPFFYYTYQDPGTDPSTNENFFGLVTASGSTKQAYAVFQGAAAQINHP